MLNVNGYGKVNLQTLKISTLHYFARVNSNRRLIQEALSAMFSINVHDLGVVTKKNYIERGQWTSQYEICFVFSAKGSSNKNT